MPCNIVSLNAKGLNHPAKRHSLWHTAAKLNCDILCVQETHLLPAATTLCHNRQYPQIYHATYSSKKRGVLIAIKQGLDFQLLQQTPDPNGRYLILSFTLNKVSYTLMNLYAPNTRQISFLKKALTKARAVCKGHLIICGDFNLVPDIHMDTTSPAKRRESPLGRLLTSHDIFDVWRCHHGSEKDFTYFSPRHNSYSRIDLFLTDKWLLQNISASVIHTVTWSDHAPISISITDMPPQRNTFLWRANNYILQHPTYSLDIEKHISDYFDLNKGSVGDPVTVWNAHKAVIRGIVMKLSSVCKKKEDAANRHPYLPNSDS